jgi:hypothetical protein
MPDSKLQIKIGDLEFTAEGDPSWLEKQLDKVLEKSPTLMAQQTSLPAKSAPASTDAHTPMAPDPGISTKPLATFLKEKGATSNQVKKFLATAVWLESKGNSRMATGDVVKALAGANQSKLSNASQCLVGNTQKGYCEKEGGQFFVTSAGKDSLG